jgi:hypothetical protein
MRRNSIQCDLNCITGLKLGGAMIVQVRFSHKWQKHPNAATVTQSGNVAAKSAPQFIFPKCLCGMKVLIGVLVFPEIWLFV